MTTLLLALLAGAVVGLAPGGLGGGGSMPAVPALIYLFGFSPADAITAALLIVAAPSLTGLLARARAGRVPWRSGLPVAAAGSSSSPRSSRSSLSRWPRRSAPARW